MPKNKNKQPKAAYHPFSAKQARALDADIPGMHLKWSLDRFDWGGPYCANKMTVQEFSAAIITPLKNAETMKWGEVEGATGSHFVEVDALTKDARRRLEEINLDDLDQLFSFRCGGRPRIWGTRDIAIFRVLWWDPEHGICPSQKKHT